MQRDGRPVTRVRSAATAAVLLALPFTTMLGCGGSDAAQAAQATSPDGEAEDASDAEASFAAVLLGEFSIRHLRPVENLRVEAEFRLHGTVREENEQRLVGMIAAREHRIRDQVIVAVRSAETFEFDEPELLRLRRRIHFQLSKVIPDGLMRDIYVTDFQCHIN